MLIGLLALGSVLSLELLEPSVQAATHVDNPFVGATSYINHDYAALIDASIAQTSDNTLKGKMQTIKTYPTAVWLDRIAAIGGGSQNSGRLSLEGHLDAALAQQQGSTPITATFVIYDLPGRDCAALASNGELPLTAAGLQTYQTSYIDAIAAIFAKAKYQNIRIIAIVEPDGLPNLVTNLSVNACAQANSSGIYVSGIQYALNKLHAVSNVYTYMDIGHSGWLGWDNNLQGVVQLFTSTVQATTAGLASVDGFISNTSNYTPVAEPYLTDSNLSVGGQPVRSANFYQWNPNFDESDFSASLYTSFVNAGWPSNIGFLIDTSRNGWGGANRPSGASGSDINTYVDSGRIDRRDHRGLWCNVNGAGLGAPPQAAPAGYPNSHLDAFVWVKPPGESDGASSQIVNDEGKGADPNCDPTYTTSAGVKSGAMPNAPLAGHWFHDQFVMLIQNASPQVPIGNNTPTPTPTVTPTPTATPTPTPTPTVTPTPTPTVTPTSTPTPTPTPTVTPTPTPTPGPGSIEVQLMNANTAATSNQLYPRFRVINTGTSGIDLANLKLRYYYTKDGSQAQTFNVDWAANVYTGLPSGSVIGSFVSASGTNTDTYLEISFTGSAGTLAPGATLEVQTRVNKSDWSNYNQANDYSFNATATTFVDWSKVTGYISGSLKWGTAP